jgi:hypothetical protein
MRTAIVVWLMSAGFAISAPRVEARDEAVISVRLYDYAGISEETLADTQRLVANFYTPAGVTIDWASTFRPHRRKDREGDNGRLQDFTINILNRSMVARTNWPPDALGSAVVSREGQGTIAYVLFDRLKTAAAASHWPVQDLLALVVAHELGHLLLPPGSHSDGLMRGGWDVSELRRMRLDSLAFSPDHLALIRERLSHMVAAQ